MVKAILNQPNSDMFSSSNLGSGSGESFGESYWKVFVYDGFCRDIISPFFTVRELKECGVTLNLMLHDTRQAIRDFPAVYFIQSTRENLTRVIADLNLRLYDKIYLNFTSISDEDLSWFAEQVAGLAVDVESVLCRLMVRHSDFRCLGKHLISLAHSRSYTSLYASSDALTEKYLRTLSSSLLSLITTIGSVPYIYVPHASPIAKYIAETLTRTIQQHLPGLPQLRGELRGGGVNGHVHVRRPVMLLLDRHSDLPAMFHHSIHYISMLADLFAFNANRVTVTESDGKRITHDVDVDDGFWTSTHTAPITEVAEANQLFVEQYKRDMDVVNAKHSDLTVMRENMTKVPLLTRRKKQLDLHLELGSRIMELTRERKLNEYFNMEEALMTTAPSTSTQQGATHLHTLNSLRGHQDVSSELLKLVRTHGTVQDKFRLFLVYAFSPAEDPKITEQLVEAIRNSLPDSLADEHKSPTHARPSLTPLQALDCLTAYVKTLKFTHSLSRPIQPSPAPSTVSTQAPQSSLVSSIFSSLTTGASLASGIASGLAASVQKHLGEAGSPYTSVQIVQGIINHDPAVLERLAVVDPLNTNTHATASAPPHPQHLLVTMVGGGSYGEYCALQSIVRENVNAGGLEVAYCCSELMTAEDMIGVWEELGSVRK